MAVDGIMIQGIIHEIISAGSHGAYLFKIVIGLKNTHHAGKASLHHTFVKHIGRANPAHGHCILYVVEHYRNRSPVAYLFRHEPAGKIASDLVSVPLPLHAEGGDIALLGSKSGFGYLRRHVR